MRIAVVGSCGSGKSTIVAALRARGLDAYVVSQEHSIIRGLWNHLEPDAVVFLSVDYPTLQRRRGASWPRWLYDIQQERLADARANATLEIDTGRQSVDEAVERILAEVERLRRAREPAG